jgi:hypothetical protein
MQIIIGIIGVLGAVVTIILLQYVDIIGGVKAVVIPVVILIAIYCMARILPKESKPGTNLGK